jgi:DNA-binding MarR family transcriptional regulator
VHHYRHYICMCYTYIVPFESFDHLDDVLARIHAARLRPSWRRRLFEGAGAITSVSVLRALRAVERCEHSGAVASVGVVADYMAIEHSTASRLIGRIVESGLLVKSSAPDDQRRCLLMLTERGRQGLTDITARRRQLVAEAVTEWPAGDLETLLALLDRLADDFERGANA